MKTLLLLLLFLNLTLNYYGQRNIKALKTTEKITLDGRFEESVWDEVAWKSNFTQLKPVPGNKPSKPTEVGIVYNEDALYFGVKCFDDGDSVSRVLSASRC